MPGASQYTHTGLTRRLLVSIAFGVGGMRSISPNLWKREQKRFCLSPALAAGTSAREEIPLGAHRLLHLWVTCNQLYAQYGDVDKDLLWPSTFCGHITVMLPGMLTPSMMIPSGGVFLCNAVAAGGWRRRVSLMMALRCGKFAIFSCKTSCDGPVVYGETSSRSRCTCSGCCTN